jgi:hypothetical protein
MSNLDWRLSAQAMNSIRRKIPACYWDAFAGAIVSDRKDEGLRAATTNRFLFGCNSDLRSRGFAVLPFPLASEHVADLRRYFEDQSAYAGSGGAGYYSNEPTQRPLAEIRRSSALAEYSIEQILRAPHLLDYLNEPAIVDFAEHALGCVPTLYSIRAWWSFPSTSPTGLNQQYFHRDTDDWRFFSLFLHLTDVDGDSGPHQLVPGSHTMSGMIRLINGRGMDPMESFTDYFRPEFSKSCEEMFGPDIATITGRAGTACVANTLTLHRGLVPRLRPRLMVWARYGLGPNTNSIDLQCGPLSRSRLLVKLVDTPRNRFVNRLLLSFER